MGPKPPTPVYKKDMPAVPEQSAKLEEYIQAGESAHKVKKDNEARIVWFNDSVRGKTEYAVIYLHGFGASQGEGDPVHRRIAKKFGCNLYLARLAEHGLDTIDAMKKLSADKYWESVKEALAIGKQLGNKVIVMGTSTGGTNALQLAAAYPNDVMALILLSPNIEINEPNAWILNNPWGLQIATIINGSRFVDSKDQRDIYKQYWYAHYRLEAVVGLQEMLESSMTRETFSKINQPALVLYYYKDEINQDSVVKVQPMKEMFAQLSTPPSQKRAIAMPNAGDHVIGSPLKSKDVEGVEREIEKFIIEVLKIEKK